MFFGKSIILSSICSLRAINVPVLPVNVCVRPANRTVFVNMCIVRVNNRTVRPANGIVLPVNCTLFVDIRTPNVNKCNAFGRN